MLKTLLTAAVLVATPFVAAAQCSHSQQAMTCADGFVYDAETGTCVSSATS